MLERKGIDYRRVDLPPVLSRTFLRAKGFPGVTVPALTLDGQRLQGTTTLARALDAMRPEPPLFPSDADRRKAVEQAEAWADEVVQPVPRRLVWVAFRRDRAGLKSFLDGPLLGMPPDLAAATAGPLVIMAARANRATEDTAKADIAAVPGILDRIESLIADRVIGGDEPNAADYQLAACVRLLLAFDDFKPAIEGRPAEEHARAVVKDFPGRIPPVFPDGWLAPLRAVA
jgi:glutathione S-transferase